MLQRSAVAGCTSLISLNKLGPAPDLCTTLCTWGTPEYQHGNACTIGIAEGAMQVEGPAWQAWRTVTLTLPPSSA